MREVKRKVKGNKKHVGIQAICHSSVLLTESIS